MLQNKHELCNNFDSVHEFDTIASDNGLKAGILTHWSQVTQIFVYKLTIIGSD